MRKDLKQLRIVAEQQGWRVERTNGDHLKWLAPDGGMAIYSPSTPSNARGILNLKAQLRRAGLELEKHGKQKVAV